MLLPLSIPFRLCFSYQSMNLKPFKLLHHLNGKLKDGKITATVGYVENSSVMSVSLINSIDLHSFYILRL